MTAELVIALMVSLAIVVGNTMIAIAFLRSRRDSWNSTKGGAQNDMDELHRRVQELTAGRKDT